MQSLTLQISGIAALLMLLNQLWGYAPLERSLVVTIGAGTVVYSVLLVGQAVVRYVITAAAAPDIATDDAPAEPPPADASPPSPPVS
ncbi:MAG: hypothetical protein ABJF88_16645 [Rhodothermales bacterium]